MELEIPGCDTLKHKLTISAFTDITILLGFEVFMAVYFDVRYLFYDTIVTGGDTASWYGMANHMLTILLPHGRLTGWDWGNFCGYPNFTFYFIPPFLLAVLPAYFLHIPLAVALKLAMVIGMFLLPLMTYFGLRAMAYRFPVPVIGASGSMLFLFNESYTMFGGNALSTLTGEFCYMLAFGVFIYFIGSLYKGVTREEGAVKNGLLLGLIGLSHLFVFLPAASLLVYWVIEKGNLRYILKVGLTAFGLMAFWIVPLLVFRDPYTTPVYMIWQPFVNWRYTFMGIFLLLLFIGPSLSMASLGQEKSASSQWDGWDLPVLTFSALLTFSASYLALTYLILGSGLWDTGLETTALSASPLGVDWAVRLSAIPVPGALAAAALIAGLGFVAKKRRLFQSFTFHVAQVTLFFILLLASLGFFFLVCSDPALRPFWMKGSTLVFVIPILVVVIALILRRASTVLLASKKAETERLRMLLALAFACVVGYFSAHFLEVPDIRFLPPLLFVLMLILFADFLEPMISPSSQKTKVGWATVVSYLSILFIVFSAQKADTWFRFNCKGYESMPGYGEFRVLNERLKEADPLNAPRVAYEKSNFYGRYGGDRVFESLPLFSGRQTMEGIHYASTMASRFTAFLQTAYSRDIKTPRSYILSKLNPGALPSYFDLYNVSQLIVVSDEAKQALLSSPHFRKEKDFGPLSLFQYNSPSSQYVDVPRVRPVLYQGEKWLDDFVQWYKEGRFLDVLMVPQSDVRDREDRSVFTHQTAGTKDLEPFRKDVLDRQDLKIEAHLKPFRIEFTTNKIGVPHLVKASYFPHWKAEGAHGVYPVSPHLMMVIPRRERVILTYGWTSWDYLGVGITLGTLIFILAAKIVGAVKRKNRSDRENPPSVPPLQKRGEVGRADLENAREPGDPPLENRGNWQKLRIYLALVIVLLCTALIIGGAVLRNKPVRTYVNGYKAYQRGNEWMNMHKVQAAKEAFSKAVEIMEPMVRERGRYDHLDVMNCILFTAMSYEKLGEWNKAESLHRLILEEYPYSRYVAEAHVKLARAKKHDRDESLEKALVLLEQGNIVSGSALLREALRLSLESVMHYERARKEEPYSVWVQYAGEDLDKDRAYFEKKAPEITRFSLDESIKKDLQALLGLLLADAIPKPGGHGTPPLHGDLRSGTPSALGGRE